LDADPLDADPRVFGFSYSTFGRPFVGEKAQSGIKPWYKGLWAVNVKLMSRRVKAAAGNAWP
jgi:hypothetical protein